MAVPFDNQILTPDFLSFIKTVEGGVTQQGVLKGNVVFMPYPSPEDDGTFTIGYGHKLKKGEEKQFEQGLTQKQADRLLLDDVAEAKEEARYALGDKAWEKLGDMGPSKFTKGFPNFVKGLKNKDYDTMGREYHRKVDQVGERRNDLFYDKFLGDHTDVKEGAIPEIAPDKLKIKRL